MIAERVRFLPAGQKKCSRSTKTARVSPIENPHDPELITIAERILAALASAF